METAARGATPSVVLGLSAGFHDAAAAVVVDGRVVAAVEEERLSRRKHDASFPARAAACCLEIAQLDADEVDLVAFHEKPLGVLDRHLTERVRQGPLAAGSLLTETPVVAKRQFGVGRRIERWFAERGATAPAIHYAEHHTSHAAAAFYPSPFDQAAVLTVDGVGEWATATIAEGRGRRLRVERELRYPDSVGLLFSAFTAYCGFRVNSGEGELMGLAPFGDPAYADVILDEVVDLRPDGSLHLDPRCFAFSRSRHATTRRFHSLFGGPPRPLGHEPGRREADLAASVQHVLEEIVLTMAREAHLVTGLPHLCLGGGVALNCVANGRLRREGPFDDVWVQPAAGDAGNAVGAALWAWHSLSGRARTAEHPDGMHGAFLGPSFDRSVVEQWLRDHDVPHRPLPDDDDRCAVVADRLAAGQVVGWFTGRMEFGPRALGHRSILADPRSPTVRERLNVLVKERATFRPFAPAVLAHRADEWFDLTGEAPYMTFASPVRDAHLFPRGPKPDDLDAALATPRSTIPAVTHVDDSARAQTVDARRNPEFARLLGAFERATGCPVLLNTSFNARDEPIVCTPADAHATFVRTGLDLLVLEHCLVERA